MYSNEITKFTHQARQRWELMVTRPGALLVGAMLAGAYVGLGIILIMTLGQDLPLEFRKLVMGASFGIALTLVVFAGSELFTGYTMYGTFACLQRQLTVNKVVKMCLWVWFGNLLGALSLGLLYSLAAGDLINSNGTLLQAIAHKKMNTEPAALFFRAVLCNWLVCLAIWMSARMASDAARCIAIFWCLLAFIASGYEHSIANMSVFTLALLAPASDGITIIGAVYNLFWVTLGNTAGGAIFVALSYWYLGMPTKHPDESIEQTLQNSFGDKQ